jgi:hypothetical protein
VSSTETAILELLAAAAWTRMVAANPSERISIGLAIDKFGLGLLKSLISTIQEFLAESVPARY